MNQETECVIFDMDQIRSIFWMVAAVGSGRTADDFIRASRAGELIDIDYTRITHARFFHTLALVAVEHSLQFDRTKTETKKMLCDALDTAFAAVVQEH